MKQGIFKKISTFLLGSILALGVGVAVSAPHKDAMRVDATAATLVAGTNGSTCTVNNKAGIKVGTSKAGGDMSITVGAGATTLTLHAAAWKGVDGLSLNISGATASPTSIALTADDGISNNSPFTLDGSEEDFVFEITLSNVSVQTNVKFTSSTGKRFVVWEAAYEVGGTPKLKAPKPVYDKENNRVTWPAVDNANYYKVSLDGESYANQASPYEGNFAYNTEYTVYVKAFANSGYDESDAGTVTFTPRQKRTISVSATNCTYEGDGYIYDTEEASITFTASTGYDLPETAPTVTGASVKSWTNGVLTIQNPSGNVSISCTATVHVAPKYGFYEANFTAGKYVIVGDGTSEALTNATSSSRFTRTSVEISNGIITEPADTIIWEFAQVGNYWTAYNAKVGKYLGCGSSAAGSLLDNADDYAKWSISFNNGFTVTNVGKTSNNLLRQNGTYGFGAYNASNGVRVTFYKLNYIPKVFSSFTIVDGTPDKTDYIVGENFDPKGLTILANFTEPSTYTAEDVTEEIVWDPLQAGTSVTGKWQGHEVTINGLNIAEFTPVSYTKITSLDQLAIGSQVIIGAVVSNSYYSLSSFNKSYFDRANTTGTSTTMNTAVSTLVFTVEADSNGYYFRNGSNYIKRNNSDSAFGEKDSSAAWSISVGNGGLITMSNGSTGNTDFQYNSSQPRFKNYSGTQNDIYIYIKEAASEPNILKTYISRYLNPSNGDLSLLPSDHTDDNGTTCLGENGPYRKAKAAITGSGEFASYNSAFQNSTDSIVKNGKLRYTDWAKAYGDTTPFSDDVTLANGRIAFGLLENLDNKSTTSVILIISVISLATLGGTVLIRKRKEQE